MIGICPPVSIPPGSIDSVSGIIHDLLRGSSGTHILTYRLLGEDRDEAATPDSCNMPWGGGSEPITKTEGRRKTDCREHFIGLDYT
jgi:hypothetical protein